MKKITLLFALVFIFSCNKKVVELPKINHSNITEIEDVSAAYLFYNETQPDSVELNRKNLISTTNWLVNVDKRLSLKQVIPHIKFLQEKKAKAGHKNEKAKNYFTCHDTSINNLGFVEFTDIVYSNKNIANLITDNLSVASKNVIVDFNTIDSIKIYTYKEKMNINHSNIKEFTNHLNTIKDEATPDTNIIVAFNKNLSFQDYITIKSKLLELDLKNITILKEEFIY
ncbi:hypothetical protein BWZ22_11455 [Seonamhaeicola sp. S2-3]|uniref:hypothetical protein n=1 Tax=Seonamhaeicola sp. S2-3 TaxID=1936081 RepID=UPI0009729ED5|nr:hypothetical protein [Seonamhaeicola sp. S2-3]APY11812.1 hypothetical protein BWZ22_11455 [Seonamhaeicola sp. S2-3]